MDYKKKRKNIIIFSVVLILLFSIFLILNRQEEIEKIIINRKTINVELAQTTKEHYLGLSNRESICPDCGLLFIFSDLKMRQFVMRNMNFPLDIIFIKNDTIVRILENLEPEGDNPENIYSSGQAVDKVLEVKAGLSKQFDFKIGQPVTFK